MVLAVITVWEADDSNTINQLTTKNTAEMWCFLLYNDFMKKDGAVNFVVHKIHAKNHPVLIAETLANMGYDHIEISEIFIEAGRSIDKLHQVLIAENDFLPTLNENLEDYFKEGNIRIFSNIIIDRSAKSDLVAIPKTVLAYPAPAPFVVDLMKKNRGINVTRHVFAFRFLYALSIAVLSIIIAYTAIKVLLPDQQVTISYWKERVSPSLIILASLFIFFAIYIFQLFARRLQNAGMNPWLSLLLLTPFLSTLTGLSESDQKIVLLLSCIPILSVFIIALLLPTHRYKL